MNAHVKLKFFLLFAGAVSGTLNRDYPNRFRHITTQSKLTMV